MSSAMAHDAAPLADAAPTSTDATDAADATGSPDVAEDVPPDAPAPAACTATATAKSKTGAVIGDLCSPKSIPSGKTSSVQVLLTDAGTGAPRTGLDLTVSFIHTAMGHGGAKVPSATELGDGLYQVDDLAPSGMSGDWTLKLKFDTDSVTLHLTVK
jgi:hypothetical protein